MENLQEINTNNTTIDIFSKGCLVNVTKSVWGNNKKLNKAMVNEKLDSEYTKAQKNLVDSTSLKMINKKKNMATTFISSLALPFPLRGIFFVPIGMIDRIENRLKEIEIEFWNEVDIFCADYDRLREEAKENLNGLFNELDYPKNIRNKFNFEWSFITISAPGKQSMLNPEMIERENRRFQDTMEKARIEGVNALRDEMKTLVSSMVERLTDTSEGKQKGFKRSLTGNFYDFFETFKDRNIFDNEELQNIVTEAQKCLGNPSFEELKTDMSLRQNLKTDMQKVNMLIDDAIENRPARKITL